MDGVWGRARRSSRGLRADRLASAVHVPARPVVGPLQVRAAAGAGQLVAGGGTGAVERWVVRPAVSTGRGVPPPLSGGTSGGVGVWTHPRGAQGAPRARERRGGAAAARGHIGQPPGADALVVVVVALEHQHDAEAQEDRLPHLERPGQRRMEAGRPDRVVERDDLDRPARRGQRAAEAGERRRARRVVPVEHDDSQGALRERVVAARRAEDGGGGAAGDVVVAPRGAIRDARRAQAPLRPGPVGRPGRAGRVEVVAGRQQEREGVLRVGGADPPRHRRLCGAAVAPVALDGEVDAAAGGRADAGQRRDGEEGGRQSGEEERAEGAPADQSLPPAASRPSISARSSAARALRRSRAASSAAAWASWSTSGGGPAAGGGGATSGGAGSASGGAGAASETWGAACGSRAAGGRGPGPGAGAGTCDGAPACWWRRRLRARAAAAPRPAPAAVATRKRAMPFTSVLPRRWPIVLPDTAGASAGRV